MLAQTYSATHHGIEGVVIKIEAARQRSLPKIQITGLPGEIVKESRDRVRGCLASLGFNTPTCRIVVNLSPATGRKQGSQFEFAIAMGLLVTEGYLSADLILRSAFIGELSLEGRIRPVQGALPLIQALDKCPDVDQILISRDHSREAHLLGSRKIRLVDHLVEGIEFLEGKRELDRPSSVLEDPVVRTDPFPNFDSIIGQLLAKRALQIALAGRHHLLMLGPPGVGKSLLAQCAPHLLPPLEPEEFLEVSSIFDTAGVFRGWDRSRPFRAPHHTISGAGLLGGGSAIILPGEVTLSHFGVLFLDEFPEFRKDVIEGLREPIQSGKIHLNRVGSFYTLPAKFTLIAAMNPCPCGHALSSSRRCHCAWDRIAGYRKRISGAILDRIDLGVILSRPVENSPEFRGPTQEEVRRSLLSARAIQRERYGTSTLNGDDEVDLRSDSFRLEDEAREWYEELESAHELSYRALHKILRVGRTIADLSSSQMIQTEHLKEAWGLRCPDLWNLNA